MRMLRAIYNKAVMAGLAKFVFNLFHGVFTGIDRNHKRALDESKLREILTGKVSSPILKKVQLAAGVMYKLCGMPFVDLQHINLNSVVDGVLKYNRHKTGVSVNIPVNKDICKLITQLSVCQTSTLAQSRDTSIISHRCVNSMQDSNVLLRRWACLFIFRLTPSAILGLPMPFVIMCQLR